MIEGRRSPRYQSIALAVIPGALEGESVLENISITGCCVICNGAVNLEGETTYQLVIKPEGASRIRSFKLQVYRRWLRKSKDSTAVGFSIIASPKKGRQFLRYVDYLAYIHSAR